MLHRIECPYISIDLELTRQWLTRDWYFAWSFLPNGPLRPLAIYVCFCNISGGDKYKFTTSPLLWELHSSYWCSKNSSEAVKCLFFTYFQSICWKFTGSFFLIVMKIAKVRCIQSHVTKFVFSQSWTSVVSPFVQFLAQRHWRSF